MERRGTVDFERLLRSFALAGAWVFALAIAMTGVGTAERLGLGTGR